MGDYSEYDEKYVAFLYLFNVERDYYECHEVMEELWLEEGRSLLWQGLLQVAVGLHHWSNDNVSGAIKLFEAGLHKLEGYPAEAAGIDLAKVRTNAAAALGVLRHAGAADTGASDAGAAEHAHAGAATDQASAIPPFTPFDIQIVDEQLQDLVALLSHSHNS